MILLMLLLLTGCTPCNCPAPGSVERGTYDITTSDREALVGSSVDFAGDTIVIEYTGEDGSVWEVEYQVVEE